MGVRNIITFDAHDLRVQNAVPLLSFDNAMPTYQVLKSLLQKDPGISFDRGEVHCGQPGRGRYEPQYIYSSVLGYNPGHASTSAVTTPVLENGRNPHRCT